MIEHPLWIGIVAAFTMTISMIVILYQGMSLLILSLAILFVGGRQTSLVALYDRWWGTYTDKKNHKIYWMVPFWGLVFDFSPQYRHKIWQKTAPNNPRADRMDRTLNLDAAIEAGKQDREKWQQAQRYRRVRAHLFDMYEDEYLNELGDRW